MWKFVGVFAWLSKLQLGLPRNFQSLCSAGRMGIGRQAFRAMVWKSSHQEIPVGARILSA